LGNRPGRGAALTPLWAWGLGGAILGAIVGSFLATIVSRWPRDQSILSGRSHCDACGTTIEARDLIPLISALILSGKCRACGARIEAHHRWVELVAALIGASALLVTPGLEGLAGAIFGWLLLTLAALDLIHFWLPDRLTALLAALGLAAGLAGFHPGPDDRVIGALVGLAGLSLIAFAYRTFRGREGLGGGDPKLFGAIGAWLGWQALPAVLLGASVVGLAYVLVRLLKRKPLSAIDRLPLGALFALAAFPIWIVIQ
jgi:leader peptidase (prepilin peptidase) / N-methyltransferase